MRGTLIAFPEPEPTPEEEELENEAMQQVLNRMFSNNWTPIKPGPTTEELPIVNLDDYRRRN